MDGRLALRSALVPFFVAVLPLFGGNKEAAKSAQCMHSIRSCREFHLELSVAHEMQKPK